MATFLESLFCPAPPITPAQGTLILQTLGKIMATLADIQAALAAETDVVKSVIALLDSVEAQLKAAIAANDPVAMQAIADQINANKAALAAAVAANTPADPTAPTPTDPATPAPDPTTPATPDDSTRKADQP